MQKKLDCILLIDDDEPTNYLNELILRDVDCAEHIEVAQTGDEALEYLEHAVPDEHAPVPELIFLDINMPAMDGWEFLDRYDKFDPEQVVVVMLTTSLNPEDEQRAQSRSNIKCFVHKPLTKDKVEDILNKFF